MNDTPHDVELWSKEWRERYDEEHKPIADIHIVKPRNGYRYELDGKLLNNGSHTPTREPRVASLMACFLKFSTGRQFTIKEAVSANYDVGRQSVSMKYKSHWSQYTPEQLKESVCSDWWVKVNVADNLQGAVRNHLELIFRDCTITVSRTAPGTYKFNVEMNRTEIPQLDCLATVMIRYHNQFEKARERWQLK